MLIVVAPRRSSIRMSQGDTGAPCAASATAMNSFPVFLACASAAPGMPTAVAKRRHLCTRFAFNPCAIATAATDAPACAHCANTRDFSSTLCLRLGSRLDSCMVPTSFVGGHHLRYQRIRLQYATARRLQKFRQAVDFRTLCPRQLGQCFFQRLQIGAQLGALWRCPHGNAGLVVVLAVLVHPCLGGFADIAVLQGYAAKGVLVGFGASAIQGIQARVLDFVPEGFLGIQCGLHTLCDKVQFTFEVKALGVIGYVVASGAPGGFNTFMQLVGDG